MARKQFGPAECGALDRAGNLGKLECGQITTDATADETPLAAWPIRLLARRHGLTIAHAALVASLAFAALPVGASR